MAARQTNSSRSRHQHHWRGTEVAADFHLALSYLYAAASEHMQYLTTPPTGSSSVSLQLCFFPLCLYVCKCVKVWVSMCTCTSVCLLATYRSNKGHSKRSSEGEEGNTTPAIWNELKPCVAAVAWHGNKKMERLTERGWKAYVGWWFHMVVVYVRGGGGGDVEGFLGMGIPPYRGISLKWPPSLQVPFTVQSPRRRQL